MKPRHRSGPTSGPTFVQVLASNPDLVAALLREHRPNSDGLCRRCGRAGTGSPHVVSPCGPAAYALAAASLAEGKGGVAALMAGGEDR